MIQSYKNRRVDIAAPVKVYRCLNRKGKVYSVKQGGYVVGHTENIQLSNVEFVVNKSGKKRALDTQQRNVHAYLLGYITEEKNRTPKNKITYYPFSTKNFYNCNTGNEIEHSSLVVINNNGVFAK